MTRIEQTGLYHKAMFDSLANVVTAFSSTIPRDEMLALFSQMVGNLAEMQDMGLYTKHDIVSTINANIEMGRRQNKVLTDLLASTKH